jgi:5-oxoprolinase (ATP-hydrolysing) subunit A
MASTIDLNCDMGEGYATDALIFPYISSANIACGYHAGDEDTIRKTIGLALAYGVAVGAHPAFPDREGFGRREMQFSTTAVYHMVLEQVRLIQTIALEMGAVLHHVKPHGALYNSCAKNGTMAMAVAQAVKDIGGDLWLYALSGSCAAAAALEVGIAVQHEVFADRTYAEDGSLQPRSTAGALITDEGESIKQVLQMINKGTVQTDSGKTIALKADTLCIHGDGLHAADLAKNIYHTLREKQVVIQAAR